MKTHYFSPDVVVLVLGALCFMHTEVTCDGDDGECVPLWTFWECLYFAYISSSSIGLGDYTPETHAGKVDRARDGL